MRVLVIGGTGYVGRAVVPALVAAGYEVSTIARQNQEMPGVAMIAADATSIDWSRALVRMDAVVNLVGIIREHRSAGVTFETMHVALVERLLAGMTRAGVSRLVQMSALGSRPGSASGYHQTKWMAEERVRRSESVAWTIVRPSLVFGGGSPFFKTLGQIAGTPLGAMIPGQGQSEFDPVFRGDLAKMMVAILEDEPGTAGQTFEVGGPGRFSLNRLIRHVAQVKGLGPVAEHHLPIGWLMRLARLGEGFSSFPVTVDQLQMLSENNTTDDHRWHRYVSPSPSPLAGDL